MNKQLTKQVRGSVNIAADCQELMDSFFAFVDGDWDKVEFIVIDDIKADGLPDAEQIGKALYRLNRCWIHRCQNLGLPGESQKLLITKIKKRWIKLQKEGVRRQIPTKKRKSARQP